MRNILDLERCTVRMPFCEIKFTVLLMNSLHQIQIALQFASSCKVCASTLRLCWVIQGSVSQTESHNWLFERCPSVQIIIETPCQAHPARFFVKCSSCSAEHVLVLATGARWAGNSGAAAQPHGLEELQEPAGGCTCICSGRRVPKYLQQLGSFSQEMLPIIPADSHSLPQET